MILYLILIVLSLIIVGYLMFKFKTPISFSALFMVLLLLLLLSPFLINNLIASYTSALPEVSVPNLVGLSTREASVYLQASNLKGRIAGEIFGSVLPQGSVVSQRPESGRRVKEGRVISLMVARRARKVSVPNLIGRPASQVEAVLREIGLKIGKKEEEASHTHQTGMVIKQTPEPEEEVDAGSLVHLVIARGPELIKVPKLIGKTLEEAVGVIQQNGLSVGKVSYQETEIVEGGIIIDQTPLEGEEVDREAEVNLVVSREIR